MKGGGSKSSVYPSKPGKPNFFGGISQDFAGIFRRCPKTLRKIVFNCRSLFPGVKKGGITGEVKRGEVVGE